MIIPLAEPFKGATHCSIYQITFDLDMPAAFVRIRFGDDSGDGLTLTPDPDIRERCCVFEGADYHDLYGSIDGTPIARALVARGFAETGTPVVDTESTEDNEVPSTPEPEGDV